MSGLGSNVDFENRSEVLEYLNNLGVEYRFGCYQEKKAEVLFEVCHLLGDFLQAIEGNQKQAYLTYKQNCDKRDFPASCETAGLYRVNNKANCGIDWNDGLRYLRKSCDMNWYSGCHRAGFVATLNPSSKKYPFKDSLPDFQQGLEDLKKACDGGEIGEACHIYSSFFLTGLDNHVKEDIPKGLEYAEKACDRKVFQACFNAARVYELGLGGVAKDSEKSEVYIKKFDAFINEIKNPDGNLEFGK
nr:cytochrome c oxidase assembly factor 7 homolog isoform X1 [Lepeophtheirus salmonis]